MYGKVKIGDKEVGMLANAASLYIYKNIFHEDFLKKMQEPNPDTDIFQKMGYVMAMQAESEKPSDLMKLNLDNFYEWLMGFEALDIILAIDEISNLYLAGKDGSSVPKKKEE